VLDEETLNTSNSVDMPNSELEAYPLARVIKDVGKTMEKIKKLPFYLEFYSVFATFALSLRQRVL
jgi:hypothetical protein